MRRITSKVSTLNETYMCGIFNSVEKKLKRCITIQDEIYVKKCFTLFGRAADDPQPLEKLS